MSATVFIDGEAGTTGLQIFERLNGRTDIDTIRLNDSQRKDAGCRRDALNAADVAILCLPDDAAREAVSLIDNPRTRVIDASTAHRTAEDWTYGFQEYSSDQRQRISGATRISNPGCYSLTSIAMLHPLVEAGLVAKDWPITINAVSGYSGGGKSLIAEFEGLEDQRCESTIFSYALGLMHKHLPEIKRWANLDHAPVFEPHVGSYRQGMLVQVPLPLWAMAGKPAPERIYEVLVRHYEDEQFVEVAPFGKPEGDRLDPECLNGTNKLRLHVLTNPDRDAVVVAGLLDNLGKGASGQAVQTLNMLIGIDEATGL
jgi:N-acetyl-gamma-glutamyl-phosphate reductase